MQLSGGCLCGGIRFHAIGVPHKIGACHCAMCRRWTGGPLMAVGVEGLKFESNGRPVVYRSSAWAERGFCPTCGSNLFYRLVETGRYIVSAGAFDDQSGFELATEVFYDEKPGYYDFAQPTKKLTGAEVFAMATAGDGDSH